MIRAWVSALFAMAPMCGALSADQATAIYHDDPVHLWNRLYRAIAVRTEAGIQYGVDSSSPLAEDFDDPRYLQSVLDEFLRSDGENLVSSDLKRALLQHDVWAAFDLAAHGDGAALRIRLAQVIEALRLSDRTIDGLVDNYSEAVKSGAFAHDFDPMQPGKAFLPPDLFDANGPWVEIGESGRGLVAPDHVVALSGRSIFRVFIRCPGGRSPTLAYLERLNLYRTPWALVPSEIGTAYLGNGEERPVRMETRRLDPATPQFPAGTVVALVRQMAVVNAALEPAATPITQSLQFRVYRKVDADGYRSLESKFADSQAVFEFAMRRRDLLAGRSGGLHQVTPDETEYQPLNKLNGTRAERLRGLAVLSTCTRCHNANGIFAVNSYTRMFDREMANPQLLPADDPDNQALTTIGWKKHQFDWGLMRGLFEANR